MTNAMRLPAWVGTMLFAVLAGCGNKEETSSAPPPAAAEEVVKLGFAAPLTGPQAHYGAEMRNGLTLAIDEANAAKPVIGGKPVRFELLAEDDQADPARGGVVAQKLVDAGIKGMLGHFNSGTPRPACRSSPWRPHRPTPPAASRPRSG
jgi:branched-chain amino acid transport system substrate-binding protein